MRSSQCQRQITILAGAAAVLVVLAGCGGGSAGKLPSQLKEFPADATNPLVDASGIYTDGWITDTGAASLQQPDGDSVVSIRGIVPKINDAAFQTDVKLFVDDVEVGRRSVGLGEFQLSAPVKKDVGKRRISVRFSSMQELPGGDGRT